MKNELLTKEEIAAELSPPPDEPLSIRSVERYINLAQVVPAVKGSGRGKQAKFRREDVDKITAAYKAAAERRENQSMALTTTKYVRDTSVARVVETVLAVDEARARILPRVSIPEKLTLSLLEASELSGLSKNILLEAINENKLKGRIIGRGWRITRAALDAYIKKL
jgi:excisionase family DNA binding protein